jgi:transposase
VHALARKDGFPLGYEVFAGNTHDSRTLQTIVATMEARHGLLGRVWITDRGMASAPIWRGCATPAGATSSAHRSRS